MGPQSAECHLDNQQSTTHCNLQDGPVNNFNKAKGVKAGRGGALCTQGQQDAGLSMQEPKAGSAPRALAKMAHE